MTKVQISARIDARLEKALDEVCRSRGRAAWGRRDPGRGRGSGVTGDAAAEVMGGPAADREA